jgi:hypothetical protein
MSDAAQPNDLFLGLVASLQASAWMQLGKIMNPLSGKVERDLDRAQETIDLLGMLQTKTRGNLHPDEARLLEQILYELRMNFVEERQGGEREPAAPAVEAAPETTGTPVEGASGSSGHSGSDDAPQTA